MMRRLAKFVIPTLFAAIAVAGMPSPAFANSGWKCTSYDSAYGKTCIEINGSGLTVGDVIGSVEGAPGMFGSHHWRFHLTTYNGDTCNPIGKPKTGACTPLNAYNESPVHTKPPADSKSYCTTIEDAPDGVGFSESECETHGVAVAYASKGDFAGFPAVTGKGHTYAHNTWICNEVQFQDSAGAWHDNGAGGSNGERGCAEVKN